MAENNGNGTADSAGTPKPEISLPDPSPTAKRWAFGFLAAAVAVAVLGDASNLDKDPPFDPSAVTEADLAIFAGFFAAAASIERILELIAPFVPWWEYPGKEIAKAAARGELTDQDKNVKVEVKTLNASDEAIALAIAHKKADRGFAILTLAALFGVLASAGLGLYLGTAIGFEISRWADIIVTGVAIGGGTKGLHELIKSLQKAKGSGSPAG